MRRPEGTVRKVLKWTAAVLAAVFLLFWATLPPAPARTTGSIDDGLRRRTLAGAYHIHSNRSDGVGDRDAIAAAAARAGLQFVIITDHGDATRPPDPPAYLHGVLCLDAIEISTAGGHYVALDMPASPYPLAGQPADVVEDVRRLGGFGIAAHPDSSKASLQWTDWSLPIDGFEWVNLDTEWRDESSRHLARGAVDYFFRSGPALAAMLDRPKTLERLDEWIPHVALAGHDAHGGWAHRTEDGDRQGILGIPSYEGSFRTFAQRVILDAEPSRAADRDGRAVFNAIRAGHTFTAIDAIAGPAFVDYHLEHGSTAVAMGQRVHFANGMALVFRSTLPSGGKATLFRGGKVVAESGTGEIRQSVSVPDGFSVDAYRVEVSAPRAPGSPPIPWLVTNSIYVVGTEYGPSPESPAIFHQLVAVDDAGSIEKDASSKASLRHEGNTWILDYELGSGERAGQYAAISLPLPPNLVSLNALRFNARTSAPSRVSVQLRFNKYGGSRYGRTVYVTPDGGEQVISMDGFKPLDGNLSVPEYSSASSILFVVDLTHAKPGQKGTVRIAELALGIRSPH